MADDGWPHMGKHAAQIGLSKLFKIRTQSWEELMGESGGMRGEYEQKALYAREILKDSVKR